MRRWHLRQYIAPSTSRTQMSISYWPLSGLVPEIPHNIPEVSHNSHKRTQADGDVHDASACFVSPAKRSAKVLRFRSPPAGKPKPVGDDDDPEILDDRPADDDFALSDDELDELDEGDEEKVPVGGSAVPAPSLQTPTFVGILSPASIVTRRASEAAGRMVLAEHNTADAVAIDGALCAPHSPGVSSCPTWSPVVQAARELFGEGFTFRDQQQLCIEALLDGNSVIALHPTGWGKTLILMTAAFMRRPGVTIIFSPLTSLMADITSRINALNRDDLRAVFINGELIAEKKNHVYEELDAIANVESDERLCLLMTPEMYSSSPRMLSSVMNLFSLNLISMVMTDEVHTVSEMGFGFRPKMLALRDVRRTLPGVPTLHTSATVTDAVLEDIYGIFELPPSVVLSRVDFSRRGTLKYEVQKVANAAQKFSVVSSIISRVIDRHQQWNDEHPDDHPDDAAFPAVGTGDFKFPVVEKPAVAIVFVRTVRQVELLIDKIRTAKPCVRFAAFHSQLKPGQKPVILDLAKAAMFDVIVSTSALECGQDIGTVSETVQAEQSSSLSASAQGFGRAGRSSAFSHSAPGIATDVYQRSKLLGSLGPLGLARQGKAELLKRMEYLENARHCRLGLFCRHFGGSPSPRCRGLCDICCGDGPEIKAELCLKEWMHRFVSPWTGILAALERQMPGVNPTLHTVLRFMREQRNSEWVGLGLCDDTVVCIIHNLLIHGGLDMEVMERAAVLVEHPDGAVMQRRNALVVLCVSHPILQEKIRTADPPIKIEVW